MCGIAGFIDFNKHSSEEILRAMTDELIHRGPDDSGIHFEDNEYAQIGLGHRRLSILDLSMLGHQPMQFQQYTVVFNGEIYNFKEIAELLSQKGYKFKSHSDTEVLLKAFDCWGTKAVDHFIGMFAFVLYDKNNDEVLFFRDRAGVKPLYYYFKDGCLLFASELKSFHKHSSFRKEIDHDNLALFLQYNYLPAPYSIFKHSFKLEPGHFLRLDLKNKDLKKHKYWDVVDHYNKPKLDISYDEAVEETEKLLMSAFSYRMVSDVPVGLFLSGGYDSTAVTALLQSQSTEKIKTFTIGYEEQAFNEAPEAKKVADYLGTDHTEKYCTAKDTADILHKLPQIYDEPFADNSVVPTFLVSQLARTKVKVALSGDAGDEIFAGYDKFNRAVNFTKLPGVAQSLMSSAMGLISPENIPVFNKKYNFSTRYEKMREIWKYKSPSHAMKVISQFITEQEARKYLTKDFQNKKTYFDIESELNNGNDPLNKLLAIDYKTFLLDNNLTKVDRATMAVGLEGREPILDHRIVEFVSQLPSSYKIKDGVNKSILKTIVHKYVPKAIMDRPKKPFLAPLTVWFKDELKDYYLEYLDETRLKNDGIFTKSVIELRNAYLSGKEINHQKLWNILIFQLWKEKWM
ncbi:asparagine synthase (glutamine-hydrolyzing) [Fulvivirga sp. 29W222]|uniref:asparagine synthase (glutamine-hydrolyzing) n=1 Tax=Fulvivirga marina TaxID=2494733 RepID=A0A937KG70_9BACT|nr:asparagine synthase (glutamine-hydrolyzing) [Fulvivirga marina]MBL6448893.1 asparagine synthase (glutamine-hydrolyzing) [Fulvivirga marina]